MNDHRDLVIEDLALAEIDARNHAATWRMIARAAIHSLAELHGELERLREQRARLIEEYRRYRAATIDTPQRAA